MDSTVPDDLLKLKDRLESWRATRKYARQPIPDEFRQAAAEMTERYSLRLSISAGLVRGVSSSLAMVSRSPFHLE